MCRHADVNMVHGIAWHKVFLSRVSHFYYSVLYNLYEL